MNPKELKDYKCHEQIGENEEVIFLNDDEQKVKNSHSKQRSLSSIYKKNDMSNLQNVNFSNLNDGNNKYSNNLENLESSSSNNLPSPRFANKKENKNFFDHNNSHKSLNIAQENSYANATQKSSNNNSNLTLPSAENLSGNKKNKINNKINGRNSSNKNSRGNLLLNKTKMKLKTPKNNLFHGN